MSQKETEQLPVKKKKSSKKKTDKKPSLTKYQRTLMKLLNVEGYAQAMKTMDEKINYKVCKDDGRSIQYTPARTINSLSKRGLIYKAVDGKYYSTKLKENDVAKPMPVTDGGIKQALLKLKPGRSKNSVTRKADKGPESAV